MIQFTIKGRLAGANEIKSANRAHWSVGAKIVKNDKELVLWTLKAAGLYQKGTFTNAAGVSFTWIEPNGKRDVDNISAGQKVILDALVASGWLVNDTRRWVKEIRHFFPDPDPRNPRIMVVVEEL